MSKIGTISISKDFSGYTSKNGNHVFRALLNANKAGEKAFEDAVIAQGYTPTRDESTGKLVYRTTNPFQDGATLILSTNGNFVIDRTREQMLIATAKQFARQGNIELAASINDAFANAIVARVMGGASTQGSGVINNGPADNGPADTDLDQGESEEERIAAELAAQAAAAAEKTEA